MKTFATYAAQGDVFFSRIDALPEGVLPVDPANGKNIIAHSETGHHHVMDAERTTLYRLPEELYEAFLVVKAGGADLTHERGFDTHEPIHFDEGVYMIRRQREYTPEGYRRAAD